jgi:hypothetical protein
MLTVRKMNIMKSNAQLRLMLVKIWRAQQEKKNG